MATQIVTPRAKGTTLPDLGPAGDEIDTMLAGITRSIDAARLLSGLAELDDEPAEARCIAIEALMERAGYLTDQVREKLTGLPGGDYDEWRR